MQSTFLGAAPVTEPGAARYYPEPGLYLAVNQVLTANPELPNLTLSIDADCEFEWLATVGTQTGTYEVRFRLPNGRYMSNARIANANLVGSAQFPVLLPHPVVIPAAGQLGIDIKDTSGASNTVQIVLWGSKRYRTR